MALWLNPLFRSFDLLKAAIIEKLKNGGAGDTRTPEITDFTDANPLMRFVDVGAGLAEQTGYYIDNAARNANPATVRRYANAVELARANDYRAKGANPATVLLTFTLETAATTGGYTIPAGAKFGTSDGIDYYLTAAVIIQAGAVQGGGMAIQGRRVTGVSLGNYTGGETLIETDGATAAGEYIGDNSVTLMFDGYAWTQQETLGYSVYDDTHYTQTVDIYGRAVALYGDGTAGKIPAYGAAVTVDYIITNGAAGNVAAAAITNAYGLDSVLTVTNNAAATGGNDTETTEQISRRIPLANRTLLRAVSLTDYEALAVIAAGVAQAKATHDCETGVEVFIAPQGGGIATPYLLAAVTDYFEGKKTTPRLTIRAAGEVRLHLTMNIQAAGQYNNGTVAAAVRGTLLAYLNAETQTIGGTLALSDLTAAVEAIEGVKDSEIIRCTPVPYARPTGINTAALIWTVAVTPLSRTAVKWKLRFVTATRYQLYAEGSYRATGDTGTELSLTELKLTVTGAYAVGGEWEFYSYPYFGNYLRLLEPSIITAVGTDIVLNITGGR